MEVKGLLGLGIGSALFLESLDFGALTKVAILLAITITPILPFVWMWAEVVPATGKRLGALRLVINISVVETGSITLAVSLAVIGFMGMVILLGPDASGISHAALLLQAMVILATTRYVSPNLMAWRLPEVSLMVFAVMMLFFVTLLIETPVP